MIRCQLIDHKYVVEVQGNEEIKTEIALIVKQFAEHPKLKLTLMASILAVDDTTGILDELVKYRDIWNHLF